MRSLISTMWIYLSKLLTRSHLFLTKIAHAVQDRRSRSSVRQCGDGPAAGRTAPPAAVDPAGADPRRDPARRIRPLSRQQRPAVITTSMSASIPRRSGSAARTPSASRCSRTTRASSSICSRTSRSSASCMDKTELKYTRDINTVYIDFPQTLETGRTYSIEFHYSGSPLEVGPVRCAGVQEGSGRRPLDQHRQRRRRLGGVVAEQGLVARRARRHGHPRRRSRTTSSTSRTAASSRRPISATATPSGTTACTIRSTATTCRSTSATTCTSASRWAT